LKSLDDVSDARSDETAAFNHMRSGRRTAELIQLRRTPSRGVPSDDDDDPPPRPAAAMAVPASLLAA
jgi:hypothetical protein